MELEKLTCAAKAGHWDLTRWLHTHLPAEVDRSSNCDLLCIAVAQSDLENVKWVIANGYPVLLYTHIIEEAASAVNKGSLEDTWNVQVEILRYLLEGGFVSPGYIADVFLPEAARVGDLETIQWVLANRAENWSYQYAFDMVVIKACERNHLAAVDSAAANGHLDVVKWLHSYRSEGCTTAAMDGAASRSFHTSTCRDGISPECCVGKAPRWFYEDQIATLNWFAFNRLEGCSAAAMDGAAANGNLKVVKWLHGYWGGLCTSGAMDRAAMGGHLDTVQWLHAHRREGCTTDAMDHASARGHLKVVQWLHVNRSEGCTARAMNFVAAFGNLAMVRWLLEHRREVNILSAMENAIVCKELEVMWFLDAQRTDRSVSLREMRVRLRNTTYSDLDPRRI